MYPYGKIVPEPYTESMNLGTRYESYSAASAYWLTKRYGGSRCTPFALYIMPDVQAGWDALAQFPYISKAADTGKLITDRLAQYGSYEYERSGETICEAFFASDDISSGEFVDMEKVFAARGGKLMDKVSPHREREPEENAISPVSLKSKENIGGAVYETYTAANRASAIAYLRQRAVDRRFYYVIVETPEGKFGRDIVGAFEQ